MKAKNDIMMQDKAFAYVAAATVFALLVPAIMTPLSPEWDWGIGDFIIMGVLLFGMGSLFVVIARMINKKYRLLAGIIIGLITLYIWAELGVGIFTNIGS